MSAEVLDRAYVEVNDSRVIARVTSPTGKTTEVPVEWTVTKDGDYLGAGLEHTVWTKGTRVVRDVVGTPIRPSDLEIGDLVDGMKLDERGNVWVTGPGGVCVFDPDGNHIGTVEVPENVGNINWGGPGWSQLFIPASSSMYRIQCKVSGNRLPYMR